MAERGDLVWDDSPRRGRHSGGGARVAGWVLLLAGVGLVSVAVLLATSPTERGEPMEGVPRELAGRWATTDPRYADRRLLIERERVELRLELGPEGRARHAIVEVRGWEEGTSRGYRIRYETAEGGDQVMEVFVEPDGALRLKNPPDVVWRRVP